MADPRKVVISPAPEHQREILDAVHDVLHGATHVAGDRLGMSGCAFVIIGMGIWAVELAELDGRASAKYLRSLADLFDPASNDGRKRRAEKDRSQAVRALYAALDLTMAEAEGNG